MTDDDRRAPPARSIVAGVTDVPTDPTTDIHEPAVPGMVPEAGPGDAPSADLDRIAADFEGVDAALGRLDDGTYWTDEVTGASIPDDVLADDPVARRAGP